MPIQNELDPILGYSVDRAARGSVDVWRVREEMLGRVRTVADCPTEHDAKVIVSALEHYLKCENDY